MQVDLLVEMRSLDHDGVMHVSFSVSAMPVLSIYDFRSKQEYIYRTNRIREITGASELIAGMYDEFLRLEPRIVNEWEQGEHLTEKFSDEVIGEVVYIGGGNLCVLYRSRDDYISCNKVFSRLVLDNAYGLNMLTACVDWTGDFEECRSAVYGALDIQKRVGRASVLPNTLPFTQVDRTTFQPIAEKVDWPSRRELTRESKDKLEAFVSKAQRDRAWAAEGKLIDDIAAEKGTDSLIAVIYFDGNSIGDRLKAVHSVSDMRRFSLDVHQALVVNAEQAIKESLGELPEQYGSHRVIIDHGDEITLVCNAHAAPFVLDAYFKALSYGDYEACAGVAIGHSHDPFTALYEIAEECCESGKKANRKNGSNHSYVDLHFCRSGILGSLEQIRDAQERNMTDRPYRIDSSYQLFLEVGRVLLRSKITRSDLKELNRAIARGHSWYRLEYERIKAKDISALSELEKLASANVLKRMLFDVTSFWDIYELRFSEHLDSSPVSE